jgi:hypothetical protein
MSMPFGKYKGREFHEMPTDYLEWVISIARQGKLLDALKKELDRRNAPPPRHRSNPLADPSIYAAALDIIARGYRYAAMANHPDRGGQVSKMQEINVAVEVLRDLLGPPRK